MKSFSHKIIQKFHLPLDILRYFMLAVEAPPPPTTLHCFFLEYILLKQTDSIISIHYPVSEPK